MNAMKWPTISETPRRVMLVDDDDLVRASLSDMLLLSGYQICGQARNGFEATRLVNDTNPDVILLDLMMPTMGGIEALQIINSSRPTCALVLSAYCSQELLNEATAAGAQGYLMKPCRPGDLSPAIETAVAQFERSRLASDAERVDEIFERAWSHIADGGSISAAVERSLADACSMLGHTGYALLARCGSRLNVWAQRGLHGLALSERLSPVDGPLGTALRRKHLSRVRLVGAPAALSSVLSAPVSAGHDFEGCFCVFAPEDHQFSTREEWLVGASVRSAEALLRRTQSNRPHSWQRWADRRQRATPARSRRR